jgi:hypothetical protein
MRYSEVTLHRDSRVFSGWIEYKLLKIGQYVATENNDNTTSYEISLDYNGKKFEATYIGGDDQNVRNVLEKWADNIQQNK